MKKVFVSIAIAASALAFTSCNSKIQKYGGSHNSAPPYNTDSVKVTKKAESKDTVLKKIPASEKNTIKKISPEINGKG